MPDSFAERLSSLQTREKVTLRQLWLELFHAPPSPKLRRDFMIPILAYRLQEQAFGTLSASTRRRLEELALKFGTNPKSTFEPRTHLRPGTRLVRQWANRVHVVNVESSGYEYLGVRYQSLSQIARLITGTRWSGPLFFGVKSKRGEKASAREAQ